MPPFAIEGPLTIVGLHEPSGLGRFLQDQAISGNMIRQVLKEVSVGRFPSKAGRRSKTGRDPVVRLSGSFPEMTPAESSVLPELGSACHGRVLQDRREAGTSR